MSEATPPAPLGIIGLGQMGAPMASRLVEAGYQVIGFDKAGTQERVPQGAIAASSVEEVASQAEIILLSLPDGAASMTVCRQVAGTVDRQVRIVVDLSTIGIEATQRCAQLLDAAGITYVDAPVSGGVAGARAGSLAVMASATAGTFAQVEPVLGVIARNHFRVGDNPGQGQAMKLLNNFLSGTSLAATSEAVLFGQRMGLDVAQIIDVLNVSTGRTTASTDKFPKHILPGTYDAGFAGSLMAKDLRLYLESVAAEGVPHQIGATIAEQWAWFDEACPGTDCTDIYKYFQQQGE